MSTFSVGGVTRLALNARHERAGEIKIAAAAADVSWRRRVEHRRQWKYRVISRDAAIARGGGGEIC